MEEGLPESYEADQDSLDGEVIWMTLLLVLCMDASKSVLFDSNLSSHSIGRSIAHWPYNSAYIYYMVRYLEVHTDCTYIGCSQIAFG